MSMSLIRNATLFSTLLLASAQMSSIPRRLRRGNVAAVAGENENSMIIREEKEVVEKEEEEVAVEEVDIDFTPVPVPERIGCNGDEYCPIDMQCQCWLFCRFCFFPPCGTCVAN
jgi:hypothetical protein